MAWKRWLGAALTAVFATSSLLTGATPAQAAPTDVYGVYNGGTVGIGVLKDWRTAGADYDKILPPGYSTDNAWDWLHAGGVYIGTGYCAQRWIEYLGESWIRAGADWVGPGRFRLAGDYYVNIVAYRC